MHGVAEWYPYKWVWWVEYIAHTLWFVPDRSIVASQVRLLPWGAGSGPEGRELAIGRSGVWSTVDGCRNLRERYKNGCGLKYRH